MAARAFKALARLPASDSPLLFPGERGGYFDIHHFRPYQWRPAQREVGIEPLRRIYDLRHTSRPSLSVPPSRLSELTRYMGASLTMIDRHYGHLARDGHDHAIELLAAENGVRGRRGHWWTPGGRRLHDAEPGLTTESPVEQVE